MWPYSSAKNPFKRTSNSAKPAYLLQRGYRLDSGAALGIELAGDSVGIAGSAHQAHCCLAAAEFKPKHKVTAVPIDRFLKQFQRECELFIMVADARSQPVYDPIASGK